MTTPWEFSLALYAHGGVAAECLRLQDAHDADVNLLLYCCWYSAGGRGALDSARLAELDRELSSWRAEVVQPLRAVRRSIKRDARLNRLPGAEDARAAVLTAELSAENVAQRRLESLSEPAPALLPDRDTRLAQCVDSLRAYLGHLGVDAERRACEALATAAMVVAGNN